MHKHTKPARCLVIATIAVLSVMTAPVRAADRFWANTGTDFGDNASWTVSAPGTGDRAVFDLEAQTQPHLTASRTIQGLVFAPNSNMATTPGSEGGGYILSGASGTKLTLTHGGTHAGARPIYQNTTGTNLILANIELASSTARREFEIRSGDLELAGVLSTVDDEQIFFGSQAGTTLTLSGHNTFTGTFGHQGAGVLKIVHTQALSTATLRFGQHGGTATGAIFDNLTGDHLTLPGNNDLELGGGDGIRFLGTHDLDFGTGTVTLSDSSGRDGPVRVVQGRLTFGGPLGENEISHCLVKRGAGTLELRGPSSYTHETQVQGGVLLLNHEDALGGANLVLRQDSDGINGVLGLGAGDFTRPLGSGAGEVRFLGGGGYSQAGGFAAYNADRIVNLGGAAAPVTWGSGGFAATVLVLGADDADGMVDFQNPIDLTNAGSADKEVHVRNGSADIDGRLSGVISNGRNLLKTGEGTLELSAENTYTGATLIHAGRLLVTGSTSTGNVTVNAVGALGGTGTVNGNVSLAGTLTPGVGAGTLTINGNLVFDDEAKARFDLGTAQDLVLLEGASQTLSNAGVVSWLFVPGSGFNPSGTYVLLDWSNAATPPNIAGLDIDSFAIENDDLKGEFRIDGETLVVDVSPIHDPSTLILVR